MRVAGRIIPFLFCAAPPVLTEPELVRSKAKLWTHICSFSGKTVVCSYMCAKKKNACGKEATTTACKRELQPFLVVSNWSTPIRLALPAKMV